MLTGLRKQAVWPNNEVVNFQAWVSYCSNPRLCCLVNNCNLSSPPVSVVLWIVLFLLCLPPPNQCPSTSLHLFLSPALHILSCHGSSSTWTFSPPATRQPPLIVSDPRTVCLILLQHPASIRPPPCRPRPVPRSLLVPWGSSVVGPSPSLCPRISPYLCESSFLVIFWCLVSFYSGDIFCVRRQQDRAPAPPVSRSPKSLSSPH